MITPSYLHLFTANILGCLNVTEFVYFQKEGYLFYSLDRKMFPTFPARATAGISKIHDLTLHLLLSIYLITDTDILRNIKIYKIYYLNAWSTFSKYFTNNIRFPFYHFCISLNLQTSRADRCYYNCQAYRFTSNSHISTTAKKTRISCCSW